MSAGLRIAAFGLLLAAVFAVSALAGRAVDVSARTLDGADTAGHAGGSEGEAMEPAPAVLPGLSLSQGGLVLSAERTALPLGDTVAFRFSVRDESGAVVREFAELHERRMHLVVVRRDLTGFQHLHPVQGADGTWEIPLRLDGAGSYRAFADFESGGERVVLGVDLSVAGELSPRPRPAVSSTSRSGPYAVELEDADGVVAREATMLRFRVTRDGEPVLPDPYLGARGHLVILRDGDLAYVHAHPEEESASAAAGTVYESELPSEGRYGLFLQFAHGGSLHTVPFTLEVRP